MVTPPLPLRFVMSAKRVEDLPPTKGEVAVVGRSNVGKSSLINAMAHRNALAKVSKTPGRTQLLNLFELSAGYTVLDLPGYGYAQVPGNVRQTWAAMIEGYLQRRENLATVISLIDAEVGPTKLDVQTLEWLRFEGLRVQVVATKHDKVKPSKREQRKAELAEGCGLEQSDILWVSAAKAVNLDELRRRMHEWMMADPARPTTVADGPTKAKAKAKATTRKQQAKAKAAQALATSTRTNDEDEW